MDYFERPLRVPGRCCFRGLSMRLVSLWWELPPRLTSNIRIRFYGLQQNLGFFDLNARHPFQHLYGRAHIGISQSLRNCHLEHLPGSCS